MWGWGIGLAAGFVALYASLIVRDLDGPESPFFELVYVALALTGAVVLAVAAAIVWGNLARSRDHVLPPPEADRRVG